MKPIPNCRTAGLLFCSVLLLVMMLSGCSTPHVVHKKPEMSPWEKSERKASLSRPTRASLPPSLNSSPAMEPMVMTPLVVEKKLPTQMISNLDLRDEADISAILRTLAKAADINLLISPQVEGRVNFAFKKVPWDEAFRSVINSSGLTYSWEGDVLQVMTIDDMKRTLEMETVLKEREDVRAEKRRVEPMQTQVIPIRYSKARNIGATLKALLTPQISGGIVGEIAPRTTISVDEENNAVIVLAIRENLEKAVALVAQLDRAKAQVHIEARIVEATRETARQLGVQWGLQSAQISNGRLISAGGPGTTLGGYNSDFPSKFAQAMDSPVGFTFGLISESLGGSELLSMQLTALQQKGRVHILSSPSITTLDNQPAVIESGEERAYRKTTGTGNILDVSLEWKKAVLKLEVIPHVVDGNYLRVEIIANKDSFDETKQQTNGEYPINTKHAETTVLLRNGETVVIGGLSIETKSDTDTGVPLLMDIPVLGALFKNKVKGKKFDETLIFITPEIIANR